MAKKDDDDLLILGALGVGYYLYGRWRNGDPATEHPWGSVGDFVEGIVGDITKWADNWGVEFAPIKEKLQELFPWLFPNEGGFPPGTLLPGSEQFNYNLGYPARFIWAGPIGTSTSNGEIVSGLPEGWYLLGEEGAFLPDERGFYRGLPRIAYLDVVDSPGWDYAVTWDYYGSNLAGPNDPFRALGPLAHQAIVKSGYPNIPGDTQGQIIEIW